jgi:hypothetical protein
VKIGQKCTQGVCITNDSHFSLKCFDSNFERKEKKRKYLLWSIESEHRTCIPSERLVLASGDSVLPKNMSMNLPILRWDKKLAEDLIYFCKCVVEEQSYWESVKNVSQLWILHGKKFRRLEQRTVSYFWKFDHDSIPQNRRLQLATNPKLETSTNHEPYFTCYISKSLS